MVGEETQAKEWATALEDSNSNCFSTAAMATCCLVIYVNTTMEGTFALRLETALLWIRLEMLLPSWL
jgi:uncharacterized protein with PIN domain